MKRSKTKHCVCTLLHSILVCDSTMEQSSKSKYPFTWIDCTDEEKEGKRNQIMYLHILLNSTMFQNSSLGILQKILCIKSWSSLSP